MKNENFFTKHKGLFIFLIILAAIVVFLIIFFSVRSAKKKAAESENNTATVERRTIVNSVSGTGTIISQNSSDVSSPSDFGLTVLSVDVAVGDVVSEGQTLCTLDASNYEAEIKDLKSQVASLEKDKADRHSAYEKNSQDISDLKNVDLSSRADELAASEKLYNDANALVTEKQDALKSYLAQAGASETDENAVKMAQDIAALQADLEAKKNSYDSKKTAYDALTAAQTELSTVSDDALSSYDTTVNAAINTINNQINILNTRVKNATLTAPTSGTVTEINVNVGETYLGGTAVMVEDAEHFYVEAEVSEYDVPDISKDMKAVIKTEATRDKELNGTVIFVAPKATPQQNSLFDMSSVVGNSSFSSLSSLTSSSSSSDATYAVTISLDDENERLRLGMNASVSIVTNTSENTLTVPYEAIYTDEDGSNYLEVDKTKKDKNGKKVTYAKKVPVTVGLEGNYYSEIISKDVKEGDTVILPEGDSDNSVNELLNIMGSDAGI